MEKDLVIQRGFTLYNRKNALVAFSTGAAPCLFVRTPVLQTSAAQKYDRSRTPTIPYVYTRQLQKHHKPLSQVNLNES